MTRILRKLSKNALRTTFRPLEAAVDRGPPDEFFFPDDYDQRDPTW